MGLRKKSLEREMNLSRQQCRLGSVVKLSSKFIPVLMVFLVIINAVSGRPSRTSEEESHIAKFLELDFEEEHKPELKIGENQTSSSGHRIFYGINTTYANVTYPKDGYSILVVDFQRVRTPFLIGAWILFASLAKIGFHMTPQLSQIFPESCLLIVVGNLVGLLLLLFGPLHIKVLTPNEFFLYMLPPIIFDAGYFMPNRLFFDNIGTILLMAVVGTIFNTMAIGLSLWTCGYLGLFKHIPMLHILLFSSLISAVDPVAVLSVFEEIHVNEILYIVVFGESLLNDAVTVVLYHMFDEFELIGPSEILATDYAYGAASFFVVALGGTVIGIIWGYLTGLVTRYTDHVRVIEPIFIFVMSYLAYLHAEIFHMSGILAITFCGITMKSYVEANVSQKSHTTIKYSLKMISSSSETIIFMFLGVATVNFDHEFDFAFVGFTIFFCVIYRILSVTVLIRIANRFRFNKLSSVDQFVISYGGLRGAVAFALALLISDNIPNKAMFITTTICIIYFTVFLQGITIKPLVKMLNVKKADKKKISMNERIHERFMDYMKAGLEDVVGMKGKQTIRERYRRFDNKYLRPHIIRDAQGAEPKILETFSKLKMKDAKEFIRRNQSLTLSRLSFTEPAGLVYREFMDKSLTSLENSTRNLDMHELDYNPSKKDLTDAKIHHLLTEELKPRRHRRLSYSRHTVDDRDLTTPVNYKMQVHIRRLLNDPKHHHHHHHHRRSKRGHPREGNNRQNHVSFPEFQENGLSKQLSDDYIYEVLQDKEEEKELKDDMSNSLSRKSTITSDWDDGLTFIVKGSIHSDDSSLTTRTDSGSFRRRSAAKNSLQMSDDGSSCIEFGGSRTALNRNTSFINHIKNLPGYESTKARFMVRQTISNKSDLTLDVQKNTPSTTTASEASLPWRNDHSYLSFGNVSRKSVDEVKLDDYHETEDLEINECLATPTATESVLPWKRDDEGEDEALKQNEFPAWASNKEYLAYNSPSTTFLGGISMKLKRESKEEIVYLAE